jgi:hypothetical protein
MDPSTPQPAGILGWRIFYAHSYGWVHIGKAACVLSAVPTVYESNEVCAGDCVSAAGRSTWIYKRPVCSVLGFQGFVDTGIMSRSSAVLLSGIFISFASFVASTYLLQSMATKIFKDAKKGELAAYLFAITPAGIFMSAVYTER